MAENISENEILVRSEAHDGLTSFDHDAIDVSVIIVNYRTPSITRKAIQSVLEHEGGLNIEIIVVDNDSGDGSVNALRIEFPDITVVDTGHNGGYAWGNNVGLCLAQGRYLLVLNPDAVLQKHTLTDAVGYMESHPEIGILGAKVLQEEGHEQITVFRYPTLSGLFWRSLVPNRIIRKSAWFGDQRYASRGYADIMDVDVVAGCFMLMPRSVFQEVGFMDDRFFMYSEETEWCWRVQQAGYKVRYNPSVKISHVGAASTGDESAWKSVEIARGNILFLRFTRGRAVAWFATAIMFLGEFPRSVRLLRGGSGIKESRGAEIWRAKCGFLFRSLLKLPSGQSPPSAKEAASC